MPAMCPLTGCKTNRGMCIHDKLMIVMGIMGVVLAGAHWGLHWF